MNNCSASLALQHDKNAIQNLAVPRCDPPQSWGYMHRIKWARALPVKPGGRLVAVAIADHINEKTGSWCLSSAQIAAETGYKDRAVRGHIQALRPYFTVEDRPGQTWRFSMPAPMMTVVQPRTKCPDPLAGPRQNLPGTPAESADVPCKEPSKYVHTPRARVSCETHGRTWYEADGQNCFECAKKRLEVKRTPRRARGGMPTYHDRPPQPESPPMSAEQTAECEERLRTEGWKQRGGEWQRY